MGRLPLVVAGALLASTLPLGRANADCIRFLETGAGDAYLVNGCNSAMNIIYVVGSPGGLGAYSGLFRTDVGPLARRLLWVRGSQPVPGRYEVRVFSCIAPTSVVYAFGGRLTCQIDMSGAG